MIASSAVLRTVLAWVFGVLAAVACLVTLVSTMRSNLGWIRVLDFPRLLELVAIGIIATGCALFLRRWRWQVVAALVLAAGWHAWRIYPYTVFAPTEVARADALAGVDPRSCFTALGLNVLQFNRDYAATIRTIEREQPDILLLMETDSRWERALAPVLRGYSHRLLQPIDNTYGMLFASRLPVSSARIADITDRDTPTVYARMATRDGQAFNYIGLHPRPPRPGQDTDDRDAKIERAALAATHDRLPVVAMGDFNDVPWSRTTRLFKKVGGFLDPRIGRGSYSTFPASIAPIGWALDQIFLTPQFTFRGLQVLDNVGSDHRPLTAQLCLMQGNADKTNGAADTGKQARLRAARTVDAIR